MWGGGACGIGVCVKTRAAIPEYVTAFEYAFVTNSEYVLDIRSLCIIVRHEFGSHCEQY